MLAEAPNKKDTRSELSVGIQDMLHYLVEFEIITQGQADMLIAYGRLAPVEKNESTDESMREVEADLRHRLEAVKYAVPAEHTRGIQAIHLYVANRHHPNIKLAFKDERLTTEVSRALSWLLTLKKPKPSSFVPTGRDKKYAGTVSPIPSVPEDY